MPQLDGPNKECMGIIFGLMPSVETLNVETSLLTNKLMKFSRLQELVHMTLKFKRPNFKNITPFLLIPKIKNDPAYKKYH